MQKVMWTGAALAMMFVTGGTFADGKSVYDASCAACHTPGVAGAPKTGDKAAWKDVIAKGNETLYNNSIKGFQGKAGFMPPKGGFANLSDADVKSAVDYMVGQAK